MNIDPNSNTAMASKVRAMMDKTNSDIQSTRSDTESTGRKASEDIRQKKVNQTLVETRGVLHKILDDNTLFSYPIPESKTKGENFSNADLGALANKFQGGGASSLTNAFVAALLEIIENMLNSATNVIDLQQKSFAQTSSALLAAGSMAQTSMEMANSTLAQANSAARTQFFSSLVGLGSSVFGLASLAKQSVTPKGMTENLQQFKSKFGMDKATDAEFVEFAKNMKTADREDLIKSLQSADPNLADTLKRFEVESANKYAHENEALSKEVKDTLDFVTEHQNDPSVVSKRLDELQTIVGQEKHKEFVAEAGKPEATQRFTWSHEKNRLTVHDMDAETTERLLDAGLISQHNISTSANGTFSCELDTMIKTKTISDPADSSGATTFEEVHYLRQSEIDPSKFEYTVLTAKLDGAEDFVRDASGAIVTELKFQPELNVKLCDKVTKEDAVFDPSLPTENQKLKNEELKRFAEKMTDISIMHDVSVSKKVHDALEKHETSYRRDEAGVARRQGMDRFRQEKEKFVVEKGEIESQRSQKEQQISQIQLEIDAAEAELAAVQPNIAAHKAEIETYKIQIAADRTRIDEISKEIAVKKEQTKVKIGRIEKETTDQIRLKEQEIKRQSLIIKGLKTEHTSEIDEQLKSVIKGRIDNEEAVLTGLQDNKDLLHTDGERKKAEWQELEVVDIDRLQAKKSLLETGLKDKRTNSRHVQDELFELQSINLTAVAHRASLANEIKEKEILQQRAGDLSREISRLDEDIPRLEGNITRTETAVLSVKDKLNTETARALENYVHAEQQRAGLKSIDKIFEEKNRSTHIGQDTDYQRLHEITSKVTSDGDASLQRVTTIAQFVVPGVIAFGSGIATQQAQMNEALSRNTATQAQAIQGQNDAALKLLQQTASDLLNSSTTCLEKLLEAILSAFSAAQKAVESR
jgi:hypothetical protein